MSRLSPEMDTKEVILALVRCESANRDVEAEGTFNPGAAACLSKVVALHGADGVQAIKTLDRLGFYGTQIWLLYSVVFDQDDQRFFEALQTHGARDAVTQRVLDDPRFARLWARYVGG